ncbi:MAG: glutamate racemase [Acidimicrobiales bacterium]
MDDRPIGVFDSGFGGLTVARALIDLLPNEELVYAGDSARYPYGQRPHEQIRNFAEEISTYLVESCDVKMLVVACNSAASAALELLRYRFDVPVVGVIEPGLRAASSATRNGNVGVIGTTATISSGAYERAGASLRLSSALTLVACPGFVEFVERGETDSIEFRTLADDLLTPVRERRVDTLLLGCTHYPFLARTISDVIGPDVVLVSSAEETAFEVRRLLESMGAGRRSSGKGRHRFASSGDLDWFVAMGRRFLGPELEAAEYVDFATEFAERDAGRAMEATPPGTGVGNHG